MSNNLPSISQKFLAWSVHVFTASGLLAAFMALVAIDQGKLTECWWWLILCLIIDGIDGTFARMAKVDEVLPHIDGKYIDYVIDFMTYAVIPVFFFYKVSLTSASLMPFAVTIMLLSSALYYGKKDMTGGGSYFVGFPVLWNVIVFLLFFVTSFGEVGNFVVILIFGILHFVPLKFAYPSRAQSYFWAHLFFAFLGMGGSTLILFDYPIESTWTHWVVLSSAVWFGGMAIYETATNYSN